MDFDVPISAAVYPIKRIDWEKVGAAAQAGRSPLHSAALSYMVEFTDSARIETRGGFAKVSYAGTGFLMIRREALVAMIIITLSFVTRTTTNRTTRLAGSPWRSALFNCIIDEKSGAYLSEDFSFCRRWTAMGGEIWADLESKLTHVGTVDFAGDMATQFSTAAAAEGE